MLGLKADSSRGAALPRSPRHTVRVFQAAPPRPASLVPRMVLPALPISLHCSRASPLCPLSLHIIQASVRAPSPEPPHGPFQHNKTSPGAQLGAPPTAASREARRVLGLEPRQPRARLSHQRPSVSHSASDAVSVHCRDSCGPRTDAGSLPPLPDKSVKSQVQCREASAVR